MKRGFNGAGIINTGQTKLPEQITMPVEKIDSKKNMKDETKEIQVVQSEEPATNLQKAALDSMNLLNESANRLNEIMKSCVSDDDIVRVKEGTAKLSVQAVDQAIKCANQIAGCIQTQVNISKVLKK